MYKDKGAKPITVTGWVLSTLYVTGFMKTDHNVTRTEIHIVP